MICEYGFGCSCMNGVGTVIITKSRRDTAQCDSLVLSDRACLSFRCDIEDWRISNQPPQSSGLFLAVVSNTVLRQNHVE